MSQSRQLAAIMFTDIVGYTALMGNDEDNAYTILKENRELQKPIIENYNGSWIKELGDGVMSCFGTVSDAVNAAIKIQEGCSLEDKYQLRIGIHLGEVILEDGDVFGDGVNIASRIQAICNPGSIFISESVFGNIANKTGIDAKFVMEVNLKNVKEAVRLYEIIIVKNGISFARNIESNIQGKEKSIAVLPFVNMSNDADQDFFCDGISEEIINALSHLDNLRVISRTSAFSFKGKNIDVREIGKKLDALNLLEGSVRKAGNKIRITTQMVSVENGSQIWSKRYDRELEDIFAIQEDIAASVATELKGYLTSDEKNVIRPHETKVEAFEYFLKGRQYFHQITLDEAEKLFEKAIQIDPYYAPAFAGLADVYSWRFEWLGGKKADLQLAEKNSNKALHLAPDMAEGHSSHAFVLSLGGKYDEAEKEFLEAIRLNPNSYEAYYYLARSSFSRGEIDKAAKYFKKASEVRQEDFQSLILLAMAQKMLGNENSKQSRSEGLSRAKKQLELNPEDRRALSLGAGGLYENGEKEEAMRWINKALEIYPTDPGVLVNGACLFSVSGDKERALDILESVVERGYGNKDWMMNDPDYNSLRDEPRFKALISRISNFNS